MVGMVGMVGIGFRFFWAGLGFGTGVWGRCGYCGGEVALHVLRVRVAMHTHVCRNEDEDTLVVHVWGGWVTGV